LIEEAKQERCVPGYDANGRFYDYYKPKIQSLVGWKATSSELRNEEAYDIVYEVIYELLPGDEFDLYPNGIMPNGQWCPSCQEKYEQVYP
jgi:hypothetical protein